MDFSVLNLQSLFFFPDIPSYRRLNFQKNSNSFYN